MAREFAKKMLEMLFLENQAQYEKSEPQKKSENPEFEMINRELDIFSGCLITFQLKNPSKSINFTKNDFVKLQYVGKEQKVKGCEVMENALEKMNMLTLENRSKEKEIEECEKKELYPGVVEEIKKQTVRIAFKPPIGGMNLPDDITFKIIPYLSNIVFERMDEAMQTLLHYKRKPLNQLIELFFEEQSYDKQGEVQKNDLLESGFVRDRIPLIQSYSPVSSDDEENPLKFLPRKISLEKKPIVFYNTNLNDCQQRAIKFALDEPKVAIIHGPPGTGKTTTVVEILLQLVKKNLKILVCAPSNAAVDNLVIKLMKANDSHELGVNMVRYGHISRVKTECAQHSSSQVVQRNRNYSKIMLKKKILTQALRGKVKNNKLAEKCWGQIQGLSQRAIKESFENTQIVLTTLTSVSDLFNCVKFDLAVIDECSQGLEASAWLVLLKVSKCILAGDHQQLSPTVISQDKYVIESLKLSLMERLLDFLGKEKVIMLTCQYRMHKLIQAWSSKKFYNNELEPHSSVANHLLRDLKRIKVEEDIEGITSSALILIDTALMPEKMESSKNTNQLYNKLEASLVCSHVARLIRLGVKPKDISVISPYNLQVKVLTIMLKSVAEVEVSSIDSFQGRENEVIIISLVRSNNNNIIGFLRDLKRMNVAVTRAKRHLAIVCDTKTIKSIGIIEHMKKTALIIPAKNCTLINFSFENNEAMKGLLQDISPTNKNKFEERGGVKGKDNEASMRPLHTVHHATRNKHRAKKGTKKNDFHHKNNRRNRNKKPKNQTVLKPLEINAQMGFSEEQMKNIKNVINQSPQKVLPIYTLATQSTINNPKTHSFAAKKEINTKQIDYLANYENIRINESNKNDKMASNTIGFVAKNNPIKIKTICSSPMETYPSVVKPHTSKDVGFSVRMPSFRLERTLFDSSPVETNQSLINAHTSQGDGVSVRLPPIRPPPPKVSNSGQTSNELTMRLKLRNYMQQSTSPRVTLYTESDVYGIKVTPSVSNSRRSSQEKEKKSSKIKKLLKDKCILM